MSFRSGCAACKGHTSQNREVRFCVSCGRYLQELPLSRQDPRIIFSVVNNVFRAAKGDDSPVTAIDLMRLYVLAWGLFYSGRTADPIVRIAEQTAQIAEKREGVMFISRFSFIEDE